MATQSPPPANASGTAMSSSSAPTPARTRRTTMAAAPSPSVPGPTIPTKTQQNGRFLANPLIWVLCRRSGSNRHLHRDRGLVEVVDADGELELPRAGRDERD